MKKTPSTLPDDIETLKKMLLERDKRIAKLERVNQTLENKLQQLLEQYNLAQYKKYSPSSESYQGDGEVLNEAEQLSDEDKAQPEVAQIDAEKLAGRVLPPSCHG